MNLVSVANFTLLKLAHKISVTSEPELEFSRFEFSSVDSVSSAYESKQYTHFGKFEIELLMI